MKITAITFAALLIAAPLAATTGGKLDTLARGSWVCEMPGDAGTERGIPVEGADFVVTLSSTYRTLDGSGTYLRTGDLVTITSGPRKGERYRVQTERMIRKLAADGTDEGMRCVKLGATMS
jgi:hypothetical protein